MNWDTVKQLAHDVKNCNGNIGDLYPHLSQTLSDVMASRSNQDMMQFGELFAFLNDERCEQWGLSELVERMNESVIQSATDAQNDSMAGWFSHDMGNHYHRIGQHAKALGYFASAKHHFEKIGEAFRVTESMQMSALCYRGMGDNAKAYDLIMQIRERVADDDWRAHPIIVQAWLERDAGDLAKAEALFQEALAISAVKDDYGWRLLHAQTLTDLANIYVRMNRFDDALRTFQESLALLEQLAFVERQIARTSLKMSKLMRCQRRWDEVSRLLKKADLIASAIQYREILMQVSLERGRMALLRGQVRLAMRHLWVALGYLRTLGANKITHKLKTMLRLTR